MRRFWALFSNFETDFMVAADLFVEEKWQDAARPVIRELIAAYGANRADLLGYNALRAFIPAWDKLQTIIAAANAEFYA